MYNRKLVGYVGDDEIRLLEINGILSLGKGSQFSEWLRNQININFGETENLRQELEDLEIMEREEIKNIKISKRKKENLIKRIAEIKALLRIREEKELLIKQYGLNKEESNYLKIVGKDNLKAQSLIYKLKSFNESFGKEMKIDEFYKLIKRLS